VTGGFPVVTILQQSACTPAVTSVHVNGQATNTIIAGTGGYFEIYGSCLGSATSVQVDGSGVTPYGAILYSGDGQVNKYFSTADTATGGSHNLTVTSLNGTSAPVQVFVVKLTLQSFKFTNSVGYQRDCRGGVVAVTAPVWPSPNAGALCPDGYTSDDNFAGDHAVYTSGGTAPQATMDGTVTFTVVPTPPQGIPSLLIRGTTNSFVGQRNIDGQTTSVGVFTLAPGASATLNAGQQTPLTIDVRVDARFVPSRTQFLNTLDIIWWLGTANADCAGQGAVTCLQMGPSKNPVYVTLAPHVLPTQYGPVMLTYVALAVGAGGETNSTTALAKTWEKFSTGSGAADVSTWDGRPMRYYSLGFNSCALDAVGIVQNVAPDPNPPGFVISESAQCGAFARLLMSVLTMNGIHSNFVSVYATDFATPDAWNGVNMVIKNWHPIAQSQPGSHSPWLYNLKLNPGQSADLMVPTPASFGDLFNDPGKAGQGSGTPREKVFERHFIVQVVGEVPGCTAYGALSTSTLYDPSYGVTYSPYSAGGNPATTQAGFEHDAVSGFAARIPVYGNTEFDANWHFRAPLPGQPDITFQCLFSY
jgi:hypothetical protein